MSRETRCAYCFEKCGSAMAVPWNWKMSHPPMQCRYYDHYRQKTGVINPREKNTLFKPFSSDCGMTRFRAYQTLIYIIWALRLTPLCHWFFFRNSEKCIDSISSHCTINDWMNYVKLYSLIVLKNQCKIAELCVYRFKTAVIMCIHITTWIFIISILDSDTISKPWVWFMLFEHRLKIK